MLISDLVNKTKLDTPKRMEKDFQALVELQADADNIAKTTRLLKSSIAITQGQKHQSLKIMTKLEDSYKQCLDDLDRLYASLRIEQDFENLQGISFEFMQTLLQARDLKINIRQKAINLFFEWERLRQAVGGKDTPLGMSNI
jgi:hypothetical protein